VGFISQVGEPNIMPRITEDLVLGAKYSYGAAGGMLLRIFDVSGLVPGVDTLAQAAGATDSSSGRTMPRYGDPHPAVPGLYVCLIEAEPIEQSRGAARVQVKYGSPELAGSSNAVQIAIRGSNGTKILSLLPDGTPMIVKYTDPSGNALQDRLQLSVLSPNTLLEFTRQESASPLSRSLSFRRTVNSTTWQGGAANTWLCRDVDAMSLAALSRYEVKYVFEYDPDGWARMEYYVDRYTGKIPDDVQMSSNNDKGIAKLLPYAAKDFSQLGLPNAG
jgi:hypothetical protein